MLTAPNVSWKISLFTTMHGGINPHFRGVALMVKDMKNPSKAALALGGTLHSANIKFVAAPAETFDVPNDGEGLLIGPTEDQ